MELEFEWTWENHSQASANVRSALRPAEDAASVDVLLRRPGEIEQRRDDPAYMDWDIARDGIILYPPGADSQSLRPMAPTPTQVRERKPYESVKDWLGRVDEDLRVIRQALAAGESAAWGAAGFHAQQAAEKFLKILLVQRGVRPPTIHELDKLIAHVHEAGYDFPAFAEECRLLNEYAVAVRYPERRPIPNEKCGRAVIAAAQQIIDAAKERM